VRRGVSPVRRLTCARPPPQDEDSEAVLAADFEIGHFIRERIVPRAVLYFTGEAIEDDDDDDVSTRGQLGVN